MQCKHNSYTDSDVKIKYVMTKLQVRIIQGKIESLGEQKALVGGEDSAMRWMQGVSRSVGRTFVERDGIGQDDTENDHE